MPHTWRANDANGPEPVNSARFIVSDSSVCSGVPLKFSNMNSRRAPVGEIEVADDAGDLDAVIGARRSRPC